MRFLISLVSPHVWKQEPTLNRLSTALPFLDRSYKPRHTSCGCWVWLPSRSEAFFFLTDLSIFILTLFSGAAGSGQRILTLSPPGRAAQTSAGPLNHGLNLWLFHTLIQQEQFCMPFPSFNYKVCPHSFSGGNNRNWGNLYSGRPLTHSPHGVPHPLSSGSSEWETRT